MTFSLYFDEDIPITLAYALRLRGYDVLTTQEANQKGASDRSQLLKAIQTKRSLVSFNIKDFIPLHLVFLKQGKHHKGIILAHQDSIGELIQGLSRLLTAKDAEDLIDQIIWLRNWIKR